LSRLLRRRLDRLEEKSRSSPRPVEASGTVAEIRAIDKDICRLEAEIAAVEITLTDEERAEARKADAVLTLRLEGLDPDEKISLLEQELEQAADVEEVEGGGGVR
jgi:hypothetical protein